MLKKFIFSLSAIIALSLVVMAQDKSVTFTGHIVDKACSARVLKKDNVQAAAAAETKSCALMENCAKSGFGVFADGKYTEFSDKGNALAKAALEKSKKDKGATFKVTGKVVGGKMEVDNITEVE